MLHHPTYITGQLNIQILQSWQFQFWETITKVNWRSKTYQLKCIQYRQVISEGFNIGIRSLQY